MAARPSSYISGYPLRLDAIGCRKMRIIKKLIVIVDYSDDLGRPWSLFDILHLNTYTNHIFMLIRYFL
jgi:hypothetical protein